MNNQLKIMCSALALLAAGQVSASTTWTLNNTKGTGVTVSAYSNTGGADNTTLEKAPGQITKMEAESILV